MSYTHLSSKTKKRKHFIIEYEDGTKEIVKEGILFSASEHKDNNIKMFMKSCGVRTLEKTDFYLDSLFAFVMKLIEDPKRLEQFKNSFIQ